MPTKNLWLVDVSLCYLDISRYYFELVTDQKNLCSATLPWEINVFVSKIRDIYILTEFD